MPDTPEQIAMLRELLARSDPNASSTDIQSMGALGRFASGGAKGTTNPLTGSISVNMQAVDNPQDLEDTVVHEGVHAQQAKQMTPMGKLSALGTGLKQGLGMGVPYGQRPDEMQAYQVQNDARQAKGLPPTPTPSFKDPRTWMQRMLPEGMGGQPIPMQANQDIQLPSTARMEAQRKHLLEQELLRRQQAKAD